MGKVCSDRRPMGKTISAIGCLSGGCVLYTTDGNPFRRRGRQLALTKVVSYFSRLFISREVNVRGPRQRFFRQYLGRLRRASGSGFVLVNSSLATSVSKKGDFKVAAY